MRTARVSRWLVPLATILLLALFATSVDWARAWSAIARADPVLLGLATVVNLGSLTLKAVRWSMFLAAAGIPGITQAVHTTFAGAALNNVLVANGGEAARMSVMARRGNVSTAPVLATMAVDRFCDLVTYVALFVVAAFALSLPPEMAAIRVPGIVVLVALAVVGVVLLWLGTASGGRDTIGVLPESPTFARRLANYCRHVARTSASVATTPRMSVAIALSLLAWAGQWATYHYAARAAGFPVSAATSLLALIVVNASFLFRLTPGNVGIFQVLYALAVASAGLDRSTAVGAAFLIQMIQYIPVTFLGLLFAPSLAPKGARPSLLPTPRTPSRTDAS